MKKKIIVLIGITIIIVLGIIFYFNNKNELNTVEITDVNLEIQDKIIYYEAKVKNKTGKNYRLKKIDIIMKDKDGNVIVTVTNDINKILKENEIIIISSQTKANIKKKKITKIDYKINDIDYISKNMDLFVQKINYIVR